MRPTISFALIPALLLLLVLVTPGAEAKKKGKAAKFVMHGDHSLDVKPFEDDPREFVCVLHESKHGKATKGNPQFCETADGASIIVTESYANGDDDDDEGYDATSRRVRMLKGGPKRKKYVTSIIDSETGFTYYIDKDGEVTQTHTSEFPPELDAPDAVPAVGDKFINQDVLAKMRAGSDGGRKLRGAGHATASTTSITNGSGSPHSPFLDNLLPTTPAIDQNQNRRLADDGRIIDIMVLWTPKAEAAQPGTTAAEKEVNIRDLINAAIESTNQAYDNSGINTMLRLVHAQRAEGYEESADYSQNLYNLSPWHGSFDGTLSWVEGVRDQYGADFVAMIVDGGQYCGIAWLGPSSSSVYSVTSFGCVPNLTFAHEVGHNMGCNHDKGTTNSCSTSASNYGYRDPAAQYRSVLAYGCNANTVADQCDNNSGGYCVRKPFFSRPDMLYEGKPMGSSGGTTGVTDNAKQINDNRVTMANYRQSVLPVCETDSDCDDGNSCTVNTCDVVCQTDIKPDCCGNGICEEGETTLNCAQDCAGTHTMATLDQSYWYGIRGSFIDIEVKSNDVLITGFGVDLRGSGSFSLFQRSGSGSGKTSSSSGWAQVGNTVTASGSYSHPIPGGILVPAGTKHAFHVYHTGEIEHNPGSDYPSWQYFDGNYEIDVMHAYAVPNLWSGSYYGGYQASNIRVTYEFITPTNDDDCSPNPCKNGGSCTDLVGGYSCSCPAGYSGITCEIGDSASPSAMPTPLSSDFPSTAPSSQPSEYDDCDPDPCENGGICSDGFGSYLCTCPSGFEGDRCEINITSEPSADPSSSPSKEPSLVPSLAPSLSPTGSPEVSPSASPSTPIPTASPKESPSARPSGSPEASPSSAPTNSPSQFNDCASDPCVNGGACVEFPGQGMFNCSCPLGYTGARCETNVNDCADNPCQNGNCTDGINSYMCQCDIGWEGDNCDENIDDCVDHNGSPKCLNNATCADGIDSFACTCTEDFSGDLCEIEVTREPSPTPSTSPSREPSASPTLLPSSMPSKSPTGAPTASPEASPSTAPSTAPSGPPTASPETSPSNTPSKMPTRAPTASPEASPSSGPSVMASGRPSMAPSSSPTQCNNNGDCSDGIFCNGEEICTNGVCEAGTPVSCEAGVACAVGTCNEDTDTCEYQPDDSLCDRSAFCSPQTCDINIGCQTGTDPCSTGEMCDESNDVCVECMADADCTSGESFEVASCNAGVCSYICSSELCPDDGDSCTDSVCHGDGYCHNVPNGSCEPIWTTIFLNDFETGWEDFNDGGSDVARRSDGIAHSGAYAIRIRDNSDGASAMHSNDFIVSQYQGLRVEFWYYPLGMENGEDFLLEFSTDGGTSWTTAQSWARGIDFENNSWYEVSHDIDVSAIDSIRIRFRCDASQNNDRIYIDDVTFRGSTVNRNDCDPDPCLNGATCVDIGASFVCTCPPGFTGSTCETEVTETPSLSPSSSPSRVPSALPSSSPVSVPSPSPSTRPSSMSDTPSPSSIPSRSPSSTPTTAPSSSPTQCRSDTDCTSGESFEVASCNAGVCSYICSSELCPDDGDSCTDSVCHGDGYCHNVPNGSCATWQTLRFYNFDDTAGSFAGSGWNDGGGDAAIRDNIKHSGLYSLRIRDDSGSSWASSEAIDVSSYNELRVHFFFRPKNMDGAEQFHLELSTNGENFIRIRTWSVQNMVNGRWNEDTVDGIDVSISDNIQLRFVCDGNRNSDQVYLDDIKVEGK